MLAYRVSLFLVLLLFHSFPVLWSFVVLWYCLHWTDSFSWAWFFYLGFVFLKKLNFFLARLSTKNHLPGKFMSLALVLCIFVHGLLLTLALAWAFFLWLMVCVCLFLVIAIFRSEGRATRSLSTIFHLHYKVLWSSPFFISITRLCRK